MRLAASRRLQRKEAPRTQHVDSAGTDVVQRHGSDVIAAIQRRAWLVPPHLRHSSGAR